MKKRHKKLLFFGFFGFLITTAVFFFLPINKIFAAELEVNYPTLITGASVGPDTELPEYLKYVFDAGVFLGFFSVFLSLIWAGALYLLSPAMPDALASARDRVSGAISGLLILATLYLIMTTINPALAIFKLNKLEPIPPPPEPPAPAGVYFNNPSGCPNDLSAQTANIPNLGDLKNKINSINIVQNPDEELYYVAVIYDAINYWGKCQYINPNTGCQSVLPFADSASIYRYEFSPDGDGVYFYRKSFFNKEGGWFKIKNSDIKNAKIYIEKLENLSFADQSSADRDNPDGCTVPKEERDCILWNEKGACIKTQCPTLAEKNISSIKIKGNYFVLLVYFNKKEDPDVRGNGGPWNFCQAFSTIDDVNKDGPKQIKWESVRNTGRLPNYLVIIPVKEK